MANNFDTIYRVRKDKPRDALVKPYANYDNSQQSPGRNADEPIRQVQSDPGSQRHIWFYRSLQIVLTFWIVTVLTITTQPWLDYWVKTTIKKTDPNNVLGQSNTANLTKELLGDNKKVEWLFHLKNSKIEIAAPIVEGIGQDSLVQGIGHHPESVWPGKKGNVVLAGHNFDLDSENPYGKVFLELREVEIGDQVTIKHNETKYTYEIFNRTVVKPDDVSLFGKTDSWQLTFYTCEPPYTDWKRLVFQAKLVKVE